MHHALCVTSCTKHCVSHHAPCTVCHTMHHALCVTPCTMHCVSHHAPSTVCNTMHHALCVTPCTMHCVSHHALCVTPCAMDCVSHHAPSKIHNALCATPSGLAASLDTRVTRQQAGPGGLHQVQPRQHHYHTLWQVQGHPSGYSTLHFCLLHCWAHGSISEGSLIIFSVINESSYLINETSYLLSQLSVHSCV
jgi:hypothetical protein